MIHDRIALGLKGGFFIPADASDEYCKMLVAEARVVKPNGRVMWLLLSRENHFLDCEMLSFACAWSLHLQNWPGRRDTRPAQREHGSETGEQAETAGELADAEETPKRRRRVPMPPKRRKKWSSTKW
jgi:hypothetical protein